MRCREVKKFFKKSLKILISGFPQYDTISTNIYSCNFTEFDTKTIRAMLLLMQISGARQTKIQTVTLVRFELSLDMFMKVIVLIFSNNSQLFGWHLMRQIIFISTQIIKTTYSLIAVMRSV